MTAALIAMGGNLGDVLGNFRGALLGLSEGGVEVTAVSSAYRTRAMVPPERTDPAPDYLNAACAVVTAGSAEALLTMMQSLEDAAGRERSGKWSDRTLDLDLIVFGNAVRRGPALTLPHPGLFERPFVLQPLVEIAPNTRVPPGKRTIADVLAGLATPEEGILGAQRDWWRD